MADLTLEVAQSHREAPHQTGFSTKQHAARRKKRKKKPPVQLIAQKFVSVLKYSPAQPRDDQGQWTTGGLPTLPKVSGILDAIHRADGGFTYHAVTGEQPTTGFALSLHPDREAIMDDSQATVVALAQYAAKNWDLLKESGNFMGGWHNPDDGKVYLDVSTVVKTAEEADRLAREAKQIAYFDLVKGQSIKIGTRHAAKADTASHRSTGRTTDTRRPDRPLQAVDGTGSHAGGNRAGEADSFTTVLKYSPTQQRDKSGRWTEGGGAGPAKLPPAVLKALKGKRTVGADGVVGQTDFDPPVVLSQAQRKAFVKKHAERETEMDVAFDAEGRIVAMRSDGQKTSTYPALHENKVEGMHNHPNGHAIQSWEDFKMSADHPVTTVAKREDGVIETMRVTMTPLGKKSFVADMRKVFEWAQGLEMETIRKQWAAGEQIKSSEAVIRTYERAWQAMVDAEYVTVERS
jgi:hypothetical protein